ncbi:MAG: hypothetical protein KDD47_22790 [Acidobacteria bacterium]|nr:hypothetical protein [Acidobacteriota bacterium]
MTRFFRLGLICLAMLPALLSISCGSLGVGRIAASYRQPKIVQVPVMLSPAGKNLIPPRARLVVGDIQGDCHSAVKDAIMRRFVDNSSYEIVTRDNLKQIQKEIEDGWSGAFNTKTAAGLGELLGASLWIVGRVAYCGKAPTDTSRQNEKNKTLVIANLQVIEIKTGKILVSSSSEGSYVPRRFASILTHPKASLGHSGAPQAGSRKDIAQQTTRFGDFLVAVSGPVRFALQSARDLTNRLTGASKNKKGQCEEDCALEGTPYQVIRASEDMASGFADKFFARPTWELVELWENKSHDHDKAIRFVKLGHCPQAVELLENPSLERLASLQESGTAELMHNLGVALLCSNRPREAVDKLRVAYRISGSESSFRMLGLANKIAEWAVSIDVEPEPGVQPFLPGFELPPAPVTEESGAAEPSSAVGR